MRFANLARSIAICLFTIIFFLFSGSLVYAASDKTKKEGATRKKGPPPVPVRVAPVAERLVSNQISLIGTTEGVITSTIAAEVPGVVEDFPVKAGDFVKKGQLLVRLKDTEIRLRLKSYVAERERVRANLENAERELKRIRKLRQTGSISENKLDVAHFTQRALSKAFLRSQAEIDHMEYQIKQKKVFAPFSGFVATEHTQVGEWVKPGGPVVTLMDMDQVLVTVDVPERFALKISPDNPVRVLISSVTDRWLSGEIYAILPQGDPTARTMPVRVRVDNPDHRIRAGMAAQVAFNLVDTKQALLVPKDAVVIAGDTRMVYTVAAGKAVPVGIDILGYYDGNVAVSGNLKPGMVVVIRGNERLRPGQPVRVIE